MCVFTIALDMFCNTILYLLIIFIGGIFGQALINKYKNLSISTVLLTKAHLIITFTHMLYFKYLFNFHPDKTLVLSMIYHLVIVVNQ